MTEPSGIAGGGTLWHGRFAGGPSEALMAFTVSLPFDQRLAADNRIGIAVERNDVGARIQDRRGIPACAKSAVEDDLAGGRLKACENLGEKNRNVADRSAIGFRRTSALIRHHSVSPH